jgi:hypothetical protein
MAASVKNKRPNKSKSGKKTSAKSSKKKAPAKRSAKKFAAKKKVVKKIKKAPAKKVKKPVKKSAPAKKKVVKKTAKKISKSLKKPVKKTLELKKKPAKKVKKSTVKLLKKKTVKKTAPAKKKVMKKASKPAKKTVKKSAPAKKKPAKPVVKAPVQKPSAPQPKPVASVAAPKPPIAPQVQPKPVIPPQAPVESGLSTSVQGVALIEAVINKIQKEGLKQFGGYSFDTPKPLSSEQIDSLTFPGGKPLSPCIKRWLRFDASWFEALGWLTRNENGVSFTGKIVSEFAAKEYGEDMKEFFAPLDKIFDGFLFLLPLGSDSRRALYVGKTDEVGEYPVFYTDIDDGADVGLMYPGFDVYMADLVGLFQLEFATYTALCTHPAFKDRMKTHSDNNLRGRTNIDYFEAEDMLDD